MKNTGEHVSRAILSQTPLGDVWEERDRQDTKWGEQNHDLGIWALVLGEEYGEFCEAVLSFRALYGADASGDLKYWPRRGEHGQLWGHIREEAVQVAAVAVAIIEYLDRHAMEAMA